MGDRLTAALVVLHSKLLGKAAARLLSFTGLSASDNSASAHSGDSSALSAVNAISEISDSVIS